MSNQITKVFPNKSKIIFGLNLLFSFFGVIYLFFFGFISGLALIKTSDNLPIIPYIYNIAFFFFIPFLLVCFNAIEGSALYKAKDKNKKEFHFKIATSLVVITASCLVYVPGYFFTANYLSYLVYLLFLSLIIYVTLPNKKLTILLSSIFIFACIYSVSTGFEENYCWAKGDEAYSQALSEGKDPYSAPLTEEDKENGWTQVSVAYRAHMDCHKNFKFWEIITSKNFYIQPTMEQRGNSPGNPYEY